MINITKHICAGILLLLLSSALSAQELITVKGKVFSADKKQPIANAQVSSFDAKATAYTEEDGTFTIQVYDGKATLTIKADQYFDNEVALLNRTQVNIYLLPTNTVMYTGTYQSNEGSRKTINNIGTAVSINKKDLNQGYSATDEGLIGKISGLRVQNKSGMPGEGTVVNLRGIRSLVAENTPLIVVDGLPYLPDLENSAVINGFSKNIFAPTNLKDIESITLLKGTEAAAFGSLGSNGVLLIETEKATDLETKVQFQTVEGVGFMNKRIPLMEAEAFKNYIADVGETKYSDLNQLMEEFPFLKDDPDDNYKYKYDNNTNWQDEIYTPAVSAENILKVKGGDAVANYALSVGYLLNKGVIENTKQQKYYTRLNSDINITKRIKMFATVGFNYSTYDLMEQGMVKETNPLLTALYQAPLLSIYEQNRFKENLPNYNPVQQFGISNPKAVVSDINAQSKAYDVIVTLGLNYQLNPYLDFQAQGGMYYNYTKEDMFIPGKSSKAIAPLLNGLADNTVRSGTGEGMNYYIKGSARYSRMFNNKHDISASIGYQLLSSRRELDCGSGINTASDFYQSLGNVTTAYKRDITGYIDKWNWMNAYLIANYGFNNQYYIGASATVDASSSYGTNSGRAFVMPTVNAAWKVKNAPFLRNSELVSNLVIRGEYGMNGNSRYSSKYSRYYYTSAALRDVAGMVRAGLPNLQLKPEKNITATVGADLSLVGNLVDLGVSFYEERTKDMLLDKRMPAVYGYSTMYDNAGEIKTQGVEVDFAVNLFAKKAVRWTIGGNIATYRSEVVSLGEAKTRTVKFSDGTLLRSEVGKAPNLFYGHTVEKVFASRAEAEAAGLVSQGGRAFAAGDIKFTDRDNNHVIDDKDMTVIGNPTPDFYGAFYTNVAYKGFNLYANFTYSYGNDIYNAVRRGSESMSGWENQTRTAERRWTSDGQITDIPRANFGDPIGNARFSDRWIEDGSYLKLKEVTLSYETKRKVLLFTGLKAYVSGENLLTWTKYTGLDPEFAYSYSPEMAGIDLGKVPLARTVKVGLVLNF